MLPWVVYSMKSGNTVKIGSGSHRDRLRCVQVRMIHRQRLCRQGVGLYKDGTVVLDDYGVAIPHIRHSRWAIPKFLTDDTKLLYNLEEYG